MLTKYQIAKFLTERVKVHVTELLQKLTSNFCKLYSCLNPTGNYSTISVFYRNMKLTIALEENCCHHYVNILANLWLLNVSI